jgi:hypothetical protein
MALTFSKFYGGFNVSSSNIYISFKEGAGPELNATVAIGSYSAVDFCAAISSALNTAGSFAYAVTFDRSTRFITVTASGSFKLLGATGSTNGLSCLVTMGFMTDTTLATSATGSIVCGYEFRPQFPVQDYLPSANNESAVDATVNKTASGLVQVVRFGSQRMIKFSIQYANNNPSDSPIIRYNQSAVSELNAFMLDATSKNYIEFMYDENDVDTFEVMLLESTEKDSKGIGYELKEMLSKKLPGYFETGILTFRKIG